MKGMVFDLLCTGQRLSELCYSRAAVLSCFVSLYQLVHCHL
jgi:hypothetical protein